MSLSLTLVYILRLTVSVAVFSHLLVLGTLD